MKRIVTALLLLGCVTGINAQSTTAKKDKKKTQVEVAGDHILVQVTSDHWNGTPDSISSHMKGFSRGLNMYVMLNKPFKSNPHFSVAFGAGIGSSSMLFKTMTVNLKAVGSVLPFTNLDSFSHFKKFKLATSYLEAPIEIRYCFNPTQPNKSWKIALGAKVGTLINAHTKGKTWVAKDGTTLAGGLIEKESKRAFFNNTRLAATARVGYGNFSLYGAYQINAFFKEGSGPADVRPFSIGLCLSGL